VNRCLQLSDALLGLPTTIVQRYNFYPHRWI
jgi:hypothetical protein